MQNSNYMTGISIIAILSIGSMILTNPSLYVAAQEEQQTSSMFSAEITGEQGRPPSSTNATGFAELSLTGDGTMVYSVSAENIDNVKDVYVSASEGGRFVDLVQLRSSVNEGLTGPISGELVSGNFTEADFMDPPIAWDGKMSSLVKLIGDGIIYVYITTADPIMIAGNVVPSGANATDTES